LQVPMLHIQFLSSWWWAENPLETCRAVTTIKNIVQRCISLVVLRNMCCHLCSRKFSCKYCNVTIILMTWFL
jgi:hypothetical protein